MPVCGFPVYARSGQLFFERTPGAPKVVPSITIASPVSVAQGGRLVAVTDGGVTVWYVSHLGGTVAGPFSARRHVFLERDTVVVTGNFSTPIATLRRFGGGTPITLNPALAIFGPGPEFIGTSVLEFSPAGDFMAATSFKEMSGIPGSFFRVRWAVIPWAASPTPTIVHGFDTPPAGTACASLPPNLWDFPQAWSGTWSHDGQQAIISGSRSDACQPQRTGAILTRIVNGTPTVVPSDTIFQGVEWFWPDFTADDSILVVSEGNIGVGTCTKAKRGVASLGNRIDQDPTSVNDCSQNEGPQIFNGPPPRVVTEQVIRGRRAIRASSREGRQD
jgi:hypothetical protein